MGFPSAEITLFQEMGFTQADIDDIAKEVLKLSYSDIPGSLYLLLGEAGADHANIGEIVAGVTVPEPSTLMVMGGALLLLAITRLISDIRTPARFGLTGKSFLIGGY
jgi:hypothetical protein